MLLRVLVLRSLFSQNYISVPRNSNSFKRAGKEELFKTLLSTPALFIGLWKKSC